MEHLPFLWAIEGANFSVWGINVKAIRIFTEKVHWICMGVMRQSCNELFLAARLNVRNKTYILRVTLCSKSSHSSEPSASFTNWQVVLCVTNML